MDKTVNKELMQWVEEMEKMCQPDEVYWCDGSEEENERLLQMMVDSKMAIRLDQEKRPGCYLFRSDASDVARVENRTFVATKTKEAAGVNNNWVDPQELKATMKELYKGAMKGRTMYIIPFSMGPIGSPLSKIGVEITDSPYVVVNMRIMTRIGSEVLEQLGKDGEFVPCLHSVGMPLEEGQADVPWPCAPIEQKYISHFPEEKLIWSYGSGYGGNALLGKKCFALRIASYIAKNEGWLAEHMVILKLTNPEGIVKYVSAAFPSACGKTNLAMLVPTIPGWKVETVGDDIAWMRFGEDGKLYAINPEAGFFGVAPGTSKASNLNAKLCVKQNTLFTNVALTKDNDVWWEGMGKEAPDHLIDWKGNDWTPKSGTKAAHPNARFTTPASGCPSIADEWESFEGVPISAILIGGRRPSTIPLIHESFDWNHGVFMGSIMGSEITAAAISDKIGQVRRDPFAMLPFVGYNMCDYFQHWIDMGQKTGSDNLPKIFYVNWFKKGEDDKFLWPGFGENSRVLKWIFERTDDKNNDLAVKTEIGYMPKEEALDINGLNVSEKDLKELLKVDKDEWIRETQSIREYYKTYGDKLPEEMYNQLDALEQRIKSS